MKYETWRLVLGAWCLAGWRAERLTARPPIEPSTKHQAPSAAFRLALAAAAVLLSGAATSAAATSHVHFTPHSQYDQGLTIWYNQKALGVLAGPFSTSLNGGSLFDTYCVDLDHWDHNPADYQANLFSTALLTTGLGLPSNGQGIAWLYNHYAGLVHTPTQGAALQLAIWEVLTDNGDGFGTGHFQFKTTGATLDQANQYLTAWNHQISTATWFQAADHGDGGHWNQNLVGPPVPAPAGLALVAVGAVPLIRRLRRARRRGRSSS